ncbi:MAG: hypothetical protein ACI30O_04005 [Muribaculaceae bacterium]
MQDILTLAKAGYTAEQISALAAAEQAQPQEREQEQEQAQPQEQEQKPKQKPKQPKQKQKQEQEQEQEQPDILAELREIKSAILAGAYMGAQQPAAQDAEAALAAIINPPDVLELLGKK